MAGARHQAFDINTVHIKGRTGLRHAARVGFRQIFGVEHRAHAATATATNGFDHHADGHGAGILCRKKGLCLFQAHCARATGHQRHATLLCERTGAGLVAKQRKLLHRGANEGDASVRTGLRKVGALAQKTIAWVHRIAASLLRNRNNAGHIQISRRPPGAQCHRFIRSTHMQRLGIVLRIDGNAAHTQILHGTNQSQGDLAPIGNQNFLEHVAFLQICSLSRRRNTLPAPVAGRASMNFTSRGAL